MAVLYVLGDGPAYAIRTAREHTLESYRDWPTIPGFYVLDEGVGYVDREGRVFVTTNLVMEIESFDDLIALFDWAGDDDWHCDPETGDRLVYRRLEPVEYVFG